MTERLACVSIDLDALRHYAQIQGLDPGALPPEAEHAVATRAPPRLAELLGERSAKGTFFAVGEDLLSPKDGAKGAELLPGAATLKQVVGAGHEVGNHTLHHRYDLVRLPEEQVAHEVQAGATAIEAAVGQRPLGFRAPGYTLSAPLLRAAIAAGHRYDSSAFPAAPYYLAKASVMGALRLLGRPSSAILDRPRVLWAPAEPYRPSDAEPYARGALPLLELPIATLPGTRLPFIGTTAVSLPVPALRALYLAMRRRPFLNLELHGIDLMDRSDGAGDGLPRQQRDLRIPAAQKLARLRALLSWMADDYRLVTLGEAARAFAASL
ncbi:MAG: polysaccharide deacetylase family protein [Deltaproteobacteria bacterium]